MYSCIYYNLHVASSITAQGRSAIAASILAFESFVADNVKFNSLNEIITFIHNIINEAPNRKYNDYLVLDEPIAIEEVLYRLFINCDYSYPPTDKDMNIVWDILASLSQEDLNRIYYKNNLYSFVDNQFPTNALIYLLTTLKWPYLDPNEVPDEISVELKEFWELLKEYVYYGHQYLDKIPRVESMFRSSTIIVDTDSCIVSMDAWYRFVLEKVKHIGMKIKSNIIEPVWFNKADEFGDRPLLKVVEFAKPETEYDFLNDEIIELERIINPVQIIPQDCLRFSILNILAYCLGNMVNDYMEKYTMNTQSYSPDRKCLLKLKNEFTFRRALVMPDAKKHYADLQDLQEGNMVPANKALDIKGLELDKSGLQESTRERLKKIMYEEILKADSISQIRIVKELAKFEKEIFLSIESGSKQYFKPAKIRAAYAYDDPMRIQGVKGSYVYNALKEPHEEGIDLEIKNSVDIAKVNISTKNADKIKDTFPEVYMRLCDLLSNKEFVKGITSISLPINASVPEWLKPFIDYDSIISDNIKPFPLSVVGVTTTKNGMYTNMIQL